MGMAHSSLSWLARLMIVGHLVKDLFLHRSFLVE